MSSRDPVKENRDMRGEAMRRDRNCPDSSSGSGEARIVDWIDAAAHEVLRRIVLLNEGETPQGLADWHRICDRLSIHATGIAVASSFTAVLIGSPHLGWGIYYNSGANPSRQARYLAHELAEYITREQSWHEAAPPSAQAHEHDVRHQIARRVEAICFDEYDGNEESGRPDLSLSS